MEPLGIWQAISLGTLQGLTEFLPVSSSGHLVVAQQWLGLTLPARTLAAFDVALHAGTLVAVVCYYWKDLVRILSGKAWHLFGLLVIGTIPAAAIGIPFKSQVEALFASVTVVGVAWLVTGTVLWLTQYVRPAHFAHVGWKRALLIGCAQACALIPGVSRSGSTIAAGLFLKIQPAQAARYSFLLMLPAIGGSLLFELEHIHDLGNSMIVPSIAGAISAALVGYLALYWLIALIVRGKFRWFGLYCWIAGLIALFVANGA